MYDAIIVGARCAGSATALRLAQEGARVLVLDHRPPSSGHVPECGNVVAPGALLLREWGLLDQLVAAGCPPVRTMRIHVGAGTMEVPAGRPGAADAMYVADRTVLDPILCNAAAAAGAAVRFDVRITGLQWHDGRVAGVVGRDADGRQVAERARVVVGADGKQSFVARSVGAATYGVRGAGQCGLWACWSGTGHEAIEVFVEADRQTIVFPTHGGTSWIIAVRPIEVWPTLRADTEGGYVAQLRGVSPLAEVLPAAGRISRVSATGALDGFFRRAAGPGWALVGDAGHTKDPGPGRGISDAFVQAELLGRALQPALAGETGWEEALAVYAGGRDGWFAEVHQLTHDVADEWDPVAGIELHQRLEAACTRQLERLLGLLDADRSLVAAG